MEDASTAISDVCKAMAAKRTDCALLTSAVGTLAGIVTDNDVARKAVAEGLAVEHRAQEPHRVGRARHQGAFGSERGEPTRAAI